VLALHGTDRAGTAVYQYLARTHEEVRPGLRKSLPVYADALQHYRAGRWDRAITLFQRAISVKTKTKQNKTKQNKTKQNKTKQNKTKQNKIK
jgi:predicted Zn-dependent protease